MRRQHLTISILLSITLLHHRSTGAMHDSSSSSSIAAVGYARERPPVEVLVCSGSGLDDASVDVLDRALVCAHLWRANIRYVYTFLLNLDVSSTSRQV